jgi:hypothetical protein
MSIVAYLTTTTHCVALWGLLLKTLGGGSLLLNRMLLSAMVLKGGCKNSSKKIVSSKDEILRKTLGDRQFFDIVPTVST